MKSICIICFAVLLAGALTVQAQPTFSPALLSGIRLETKEDYAKCESTMIAAAHWLESTSMDKDVEARKDVNAFILRYLMGSPTVTILLTGGLADVIDKNPDLLSLYIASYARYSLEHKGTDVRQAAAKAGLESVINVYNKGVGLTRNKKLDKIIKMTEAQRDRFVADKLLKE